MPSYQPLVRLNQNHIEDSLSHARDSVEFQRSRAIRVEHREQLLANLFGEHRGKGFESTVARQRLVALPDMQLLHRQGADQLGDGSQLLLEIGVGEFLQDHAKGPGERRDECRVVSPVCRRRLGLFRRQLIVQRQLKRQESRARVSEPQFRVVLDDLLLADPLRPVLADCEQKLRCGKRSGHEVERRGAGESIE